MGNKCANADIVESSPVAIEGVVTPAGGMSRSDARRMLKFPKELEKDLSDSSLGKSSLGDSSNCSTKTLNEATNPAHDAEETTSEICVEKVSMESLLEEKDSVGSLRLEKFQDSGSSDQEKDSGSSDQEKDSGSSDQDKDSGSSDQEKDSGSADQEKLPPNEYKIIILTKDTEEFSCGVQEMAFETSGGFQSPLHLYPSEDHMIQRGKSGRSDCGSNLGLEEEYLDGYSSPNTSRNSAIEYFSPLKLGDRRSMKYITPSATAVDRAPLQNPSLDVRASMKSRLRMFTSESGKQFFCPVKLASECSWKI